MNINEIAKDIHQNAKDHGWWDDDRSGAEVIALCHSELSEALEEMRAGKPLAYVNYPNGVIVTDSDLYKNYKPEGVAVELVDCIIRILDYLASKNIDVERLLDIKHQYNKSRPYKHGKQF